MARVMARRGPEGSEAQQELLIATNRKLVQAAEALDAADEAEEFQAVGMRCREALLSLGRELSADVEFDAASERPKAADFSAWNEHLANALAAGASAEHVGPI